MPSVVTVLYPHPTDQEKFDSDYQEHMELITDKLPELLEGASVVRFAQSSRMPSPYYMMFQSRFEDPNSLKAALQSEGMQAIGKHSQEISSGGAPVILIGEEQS